MTRSPNLCADYNLEWHGPAIASFRIGSPRWCLWWLLVWMGVAVHLGDLEHHRQPMRRRRFMRSFYLDAASGFTPKGSKP